MSNDFYFWFMRPLAELAGQLLVLAIIAVLFFAFFLCIVLWTFLDRLYGFSPSA